MIEKPWLRDKNNFKHGLIETWIIENRGRLIWAVLTMVNKWLSAGRPKPKNLKYSIDSHESDCEGIGGIFEACGIVGFLENLIDLSKESDHESQVMGAGHKDAILGHSLKGMDIHYMVPSDKS